MQSNNITKNKTKIFLSFFVVIISLLLLSIFSANVGSIKVSYREFFEGLFLHYNENVATIIDIRFPRIFIAIIGGSAIAVSGVLLQAVMKNPLTDPGIIGISASSALVAMVITAMFPMLFFSIPIISIVGGIIAYIIIFALAWDGGTSSTRLILVGVALNMIFMGLAEAISSMSGANNSIVRSIIEGNIAQKSWADVKVLAIYVSVFLVLSVLFSNTCNLLSLDDQTAKGLGVNVDRDRFIVAMIGVILASVSTSIVGVISFLGLVVPHIARIIVGYNHKVLIPFSMFLGAFVLLLSDTIGRSIIYPNEISPAIIMSIIGGIFFVGLIKIGGTSYGN